VAKSFMTLGFMAVGAAAVTLLIIGHPHPQAQENRATPDAAKLAAIDSGLATGNAAARPPSPPADWTVLNVDTLRDDDWGRTVRYGRDLITKTYALIGPEVADAGHRYSGNNLACESCHLEAGTKKFGLPFQGVPISSKTTCPSDPTWQQPFLSIADSWDVAAFVSSHPRPQKANLDRDFPIRAEKPVDAAYGPYLDGFSREQHKFGPFLPIEEKLATLKAANRDHTPGGN